MIDFQYLSSLLRSIFIENQFVVSGVWFSWPPNLSNHFSYFDVKILTRLTLSWRCNTFENIASLATYPCLKHSDEQTLSRMTTGASAFPETGYDCGHSKFLRNHSLVCQEVLNLICRFSCWKQLHHPAALHRWVEYFRVSLFPRKLFWFVKLKINVFPLWYQRSQVDCIWFSRSLKWLGFFNSKV